MFRKNVAGQFLHFQGVDASTGGIKSGVTWTVRRCIDGTFAAATGTVTEDGTTGWYKFAMSQADTNGNNIGFNFTGTGAIPQTVNIITDGSPPDVNTAKIGGQTASASGTVTFPNATLASTTNIISASGVALAADQAVNATKIGGTTQTGRDLGASVLLSPGTGTGQIDLSSGKVLLQATQTGVTIPTVTAVSNDVGITQTGADKVWSSTTRTLTAFSTALALSVWDVLTANIATASSIGLKLKNWTLGSDNKALLSSDAQTGVTIPTVTTLTNAPSDSSGVTTLLSRLSALRAGYLDNLSAGAAALESSLQSLITTVGAAGAGLTAIPSAVWSAATRLLTAGTNIVLAKGTGVTGFNDLSAAAVNAEVDTALADYDGPTHAELTSELGSLDIPAAKDIASATRGLLTPFPSTPILDDFNRANEGPPLSGSWGASVGFLDSGLPGHVVASNQMRRPSGSDTEAESYWQEPFGANSECYIEITGLGVNSLALGVRLHDLGFSTLNGYYALINHMDEVRIWKVASGTSTLLVNEVLFLPLGVGTKWGIRAAGSLIELWSDSGDGNGWQPLLGVTDTTFAQGGFVAVGTSSSIFGLLDNFGGGNIGSLSDTVADAVWDENIVAGHQTDDTAGKKLSQALILYEGE